MEAESSPVINPNSEGVRHGERALSRVKLLIAFAEPAEQYCLFPCRSLWIFVTFAIFSQLPKREALAARLTGSEFRNRAFRSKCEVWKRVFGCLCFSVAGSGFCLPRGV